MTSTDGIVKEVSLRLATISLFIEMEAFTLEEASRR